MIELIMRTFLLLVWLVIVIACSFGLAQEARIVSAPKSKNVVVNGEAVFVCKAVGNIFSWLFSRQPAGFEENTVAIDEDQNFRQSTLKWNVTSSDDNNTTITCIVVSLDPFTKEESDPALLLVQDVLEPVTNITLTPINPTTVRISWNPPITLEGVPILGYNVTITSFTDGKIKCQLSTNSTSVQYHPDQDDVYLITVVPLNEAGAGQPANITDIIPSTSVPSTTSTSHATDNSLTVILSTNLAHTSTNVSPTSSNDNMIETSVSIVVGVCAIIVVAIVLVVVVAVVLIIVYRKKPSRQLLPIVSELQMTDLVKDVIYTDTVSRVLLSTMPSPPPLPPRNNGQCKDSGVETDDVSITTEESSQERRANFIGQPVEAIDEETDRNSFSGQKQAMTNDSEATLQEEFFTPPNHSALDNDLSSDRKPPGATAVPFSAEETAEGDDYKHIPIVPISEPVVRTSVNPQKTGEAGQNYYTDSKELPKQVQTYYLFPDTYTKRENSVEDEEDFFISSPRAAKNEMRSEMVAHQNSHQLDCGQGISETRQAIPSVKYHDKIHHSDEPEETPINESLPQAHYKKTMPAEPPDKAKRTYSCDNNVCDQAKLLDVTTDEEKEQIDLQVAHKQGVDPAELNQKGLNRSSGQLEKLQHPVLSL